MLRLTLHSLWSHKRRLVATCVAVLLGVAFMAGTLVLTSTLNRVFDDLFRGMGEGVDAQVRGPVLFESEFQGTQRDLIHESTVDSILEVPGVAAVEPFVASYSMTVLDAEGEPMGGFGPPTIVGSWEYDPQLASYTLADGRAPEAPGEVVIDMATAKDGPFDIGDEIEIITPTGREKFEVVGLSRFGDADSAAGSIFVGTTLEEAQRLAGEPDRLNSIGVRAEEGVTDVELVQRLRDANLFPGADIVTGREAADEMASDIKEGLGFFSVILRIFAAIALFVGWFVISNTFSILVAQRTRELALLRAIGASRRQVMASVLLEGWVVGLLSALLGFLAGVALAGGAMAILRAVGIDLPTASLVITPSVAVVSIVIGLGITTVAAFMPAIRATRVPPIAALRDVAIDHAGRSRIRLVLGLLALVAGLASIVPAFGDDLATSELPGVGSGMALIVVAVLLLAPVVARPLARAVGVLVQGLVIVAERFHGLLSKVRPARGNEAHQVIGTLARENAMRNPRRTASTASALIIGVTLVGFITIFANSAQKSITSAIDNGFIGDFIVQPANQASFTGVTPDLGAELSEVDGVETVTALSIFIGEMTLPDGDATEAFVNGVDPSSFGEVFTVRMSEGSLADLTPGTMVVDRLVAEEKGIEVGDRLDLVALGGYQASFEVVALSNDPALLGQWTVHNADSVKLTATPTDAMLGLTLADGVKESEVRDELEAIVDEYPTMKIQNREEFTGSLISQISAILNVIYGLLGISIVIAVIGIANTLSLSIHERTRELGLLRAMGMTRNQLRASVRWEAVIVALMGTAVGLVLSVGLSYTLVRALAGQGFSDFAVPVTGMVVVVVFGAVLGVTASLWPAYKASKLNVLEAIATD
jgi:putative ABC transport system permease protein